MLPKCRSSQIQKTSLILGGASELKLPGNNITTTVVSTLLNGVRSLKDHEISSLLLIPATPRLGRRIGFGDIHAISVWIEKDAPRAGLVPSKIDGLTSRSG